ncbi:MAG TPA: pilus assembly protein PilM [Fibrobacteraceae bacterium]|nr:pilus assembly protein PilM [Fibrobacteraceae bacterium]
MSLRDLIGRIRGEVVTTAIDVGHYAIKIAQVEHKRNEQYLIAADIEVFPPKTFEDNELRDSAAFEESLHRLIQRNFPDGLHGEVVIGINWSNGILADRMLLHKRDEQENESYILEEAGKRSPFNEEGVNLDYEVLSDDEQNEQEVLIVAAKGGTLSAWTKIFLAAGISPSILDVDAFAVTNAFLLSAPEEDLRETIALLNIGDRRSHITFVRNGSYHSTRSVQNASVDSFVSQMCRRIGMDQDVVSQILRGEKAEGYNKELFQAALVYSAEEYAVSVELALRYFTSTENQERVSKVYLTGGGASITGLADFLARKLEVHTECLNPFKNPEFMHVEKGLFGGDEISQEIVNIMVPVLGLATRKL